MLQEKLSIAFLATHILVHPFPSFTGWGGRGLAVPPSDLGYVASSYCFDDPARRRVLGGRTECSNTELPALRKVAPWSVGGKSGLKLRGRTRNAREAAGWLEARQ